MAAPVSFDDRSLPAAAVAPDRRQAIHPAVMQVLRRNIVVANHLCGTDVRPSAKRGPPLVGIALTTAIGWTLVLAPSTPLAIDALLAVGFAGLAAWRYAATMGDRRSPPVGWRPANDNPLRPVLPPHLLRC